jgi:DNA-binding GntR family transcriptional regulator
MGVKIDTPPRAGAPARPDEPLYARIARVLKDEIVSGVHPVGAQLPTEDELCTRFSVSRYTVREALRRLRDAGLVASRRGAGTVVTPVRASQSYEVMSINDLVALGSRQRFVIESIVLAVLDAKLAERTGLAAGETWLQVLGFRQEEGSERRVCRTEYYIHRDFAAVGRLLERHSGPIFPLLEDLFGHSISEVCQEIAAAEISPALAVDLDVQGGTPALEVRRTYTTTDGQVAQVTVNTHPASLFRHSMTMRRVRN